MYTSRFDTYSIKKIDVLKITSGYNPLSVFSESTFWAILLILDNNNI